MNKESYMCIKFIDAHRLWGAFTACSVNAHEYVDKEMSLPDWANTWPSKQKAPAALGQPHAAGYDSYGDYGV